MANTSLISALKLAAHEQLKAQIGDDQYNYCVMNNCEYLATAENQAIENAKDEFYKNALELAKQTAGLTAYNTALQTASETASETSVQVASLVASQVKTTVVNKMVSSLNTLVGGLDSLVDGAETLENGLIQFDSEGIDTIASFVNNTVKPTSAKIKALTKLANSYETFTEVSNNTTASTKFVLVIDSQKKEETKTTKTQETKDDDSIFKKIINLFK
jgi:putative membrane protein